MESKRFVIPTFILILILGSGQNILGQFSPADIQFVRKGVRRFIFDDHQSIPLASLRPEAIIGMSAMHPIYHHLDEKAELSVRDRHLIVQSEKESITSIWYGGFNPFATYSIDLEACSGNGEIGFVFSDADQSEQFLVTALYQNGILLDVHQKVVIDNKVMFSESIAVPQEQINQVEGRLILQMLGSGLTLYAQYEGLPIPIAQSDYSQILDLRQKKYIHSFQSSVYFKVIGGQVTIAKAESALSSGIGLADIRAITYEDGTPFLEQGRLWYTMSIRGRALPHHVQGVFSMNPSVFDIRLEGVIVFDRGDGLLRNEIASHIFYDRREKLWRGITTGFSAFASPREEKQLLAIESQQDPRFGFSVMQATPFGVVGDIEDPHILFDSDANKWRMLTCENRGGYKAIMMESDDWNHGYEHIAGPVAHNSTGTSIQKIGDTRYCFSGSQERQIFIYTYPDLKEAGTLSMDLPPWDKNSGTRVWPNIVQLPPGSPFSYVALMMDRYKYPGIQGPHWTYGALYLFHGYEP